MISTNPSNDIDLFSSAYENICLIADNVWAYNREDPYRKLNQSLWVQISKLKEYDWNENSQKFVRDVIPKSRLAKYGNYSYNILRENLYKPNCNADNKENSKKEFNEDKSEPWMHIDVEEYFTRLTSDTKLNKFLSSLNILSTIKNGESIISGEEDYKKYRKLSYDTTNATELQLQSRITNESVKGLWKSKKNSQPSINAETRIIKCFYCKKPHRLPQGSQKKASRCSYEEVCKIHHTVIISKNRYKRKDYKGNLKASLPILSPEVPEFFPKGPGIHSKYHCDAVPLQYFPSLSDKIYQRIPIPQVNTVFQTPGIPVLTTPIISPLIRSPHWMPTLPTTLPVPICTLTPQQTFTSIHSIGPIIHRPIQLHEKVIQTNRVNPIPVYQRPVELYQEQRRKTCGVDFNNLILLTKNAIKVRRSQSKTLTYETEMFRGISKQLLTVNKLASDLRSFEKKSNCDSNSSDHKNADEHVSDSKS